jgi:site-specific DNA-methyltransferase (adenine-specific)
LLDPFCGSGTTLVEGLLGGRRAVGIDLNPLAVAVAQAKIQPVTEESVLDRLMHHSSGYKGNAETDTVPDGLRTIFHPRTLRQLAYLRQSLEAHVAEDRFIRGVLLGIMHGKWRKRERGTAYLSIDMPNTFSMSPDYVKRFVGKHSLEQLPIDVFRQLRQRVHWLLRAGPLPRASRAVVLQGDATRLPAILSKNAIDRVDAIITSPPYLGVLRYGAFNWIRLWFLGFEPGPIDRLLDSTDSLDRYLSFMSSFLMAAATVLRPGAPLALVIGDVVEFGHHLRLAERVWQELADLVPFQKVTIRADRFDDSVKTTRIWGAAKKGQATPLDRVLILERMSRKSGARARAASSARRLGSAVPVVQ